MTGCDISGYAHSMGQVGTSPRTIAPCQHNLCRYTYGIMIFAGIFIIVQLKHAAKDLEAWNSSEHLEQ